jgi:two-component system, OmpR family, phosphate regulon sensor histidine kinase PhoR
MNSDTIANELQLSAVLAEANSGIIIIDNEECIVNFNVNVMKLLKTTTIEVGMDLFEAVDQIDAVVALKKILKKGLDKSSINVEVRKFKYLYRFTASVIKDNGGVVVGKIIIVSKQSLSKKFRKLREDFVANVSHELKTPLTVVKGAVETLLNGALDNRDDAEHFVKTIYRHTERLNSLISDILNLSSVEQKLKVRDIAFEKCEASLFIENLLKMYKDRIDDLEINLTVKCNEDITLYVNEQLLELAVSNLIDNAIKYNKRGGFIRIKVEKFEKSISIGVKDSGIGIAQENIPRLFERFFRVDKIKSRNIGGTGLGLSIVKQIVKAHKGIITIKSEIGIGSNFTIILPVEKMTGLSI